MCFRPFRRLPDEQRTAVYGAIEPVATHWPPTGSALPSRMTCREFSLARESGSGRIPCYEWAPALPPRATLIAVHGLGDHGRALPYVRFAESLVQEQCRVITYDQRGHGGHAGPTTGRARLPGLVEDLSTVARHAREISQDAPVVAIGLSMGSIVGILACHANPRMVDGLVAASAPLGPVSAGRVAVLAATLLGRWLPWLPIDPGIDLSRVTDNQDELARYLGDPLFRTRTRMGLASDLLGAVANLRRVVVTLQVPSLLLHGARDDISPWDDTVAADIAGGNRTVRTFDNGHHNLFLDNANNEVFDTINQWCASLRARTEVAPEHAATLPSG